MSAVVKATAEGVAEGAQARVELGPAPEHIRDNIKVVRHEAAGYLVVVDVADAKGRPYPYSVEFGSVHAPAYPFLLPAAASMAEPAEQMAAVVLRGL